AIAAYAAAFQADRKKGTLETAERARILENAGTSYRQLGQTDDAVRLLKQAIQEDPGRAGAYYQLALAQSVAGRFQDALRALDKALASASTPAELRKTSLLARTDSELDPLRDLPE